VNGRGNEEITGGENRNIANFHYEIRKFYSSPNILRYSVHDRPNGRDHGHMGGGATGWRVCNRRGWDDVKSLLKKCARSEVFTAATMKNAAAFWDVTPCGSYKNRVSEKRSASIIRVTRKDELGTTLAVTSNRSTLRRNTN
jgi:hypothetical protein